MHDLIISVFKDLIGLRFQVGLVQNNIVSIFFLNKIILFFDKKLKLT
jgi:hypothetical protein